MKMKTFHIVLVILLGIAVTLGCRQKSGQSDEKTGKGVKPELISKWSTDMVMQTPELVCYDPANDVLYVANIQGKPNEKDGNGFISKVSPEGEVLELKWVAGLDAPKGMGVYEGKLYVTNIDEIVEIDIGEGSISNRYSLEGAQFANDIAINEAGTVFASDMSGGRIYRLKEVSAEKPEWVVYYQRQPIDWHQRRCIKSRL